MSFTTRVHIHICVYLSKERKLAGLPRAQGSNVSKVLVSSAALSSSLMSSASASSSPSSMGWLSLGEEDFSIASPNFLRILAGRGSLADLWPSRP